MSDDFFCPMEDPNGGYRVAQMWDNAASYTRERSGWELVQGWPLELLTVQSGASAV